MSSSKITELFLRLFPFLTVVQRFALLSDQLPLCCSKLGLQIRISFILIKKMGNRFVFMHSGLHIAGSPGIRSCRQMSMLNKMIVRDDLHCSHLPLAIAKRAILRSGKTNDSLQLVRMTG
eukprot:TRINITY_DN12470_c0_g2_i12.p4 TRINITY_DN12470_c0_g2~~TRINITY_DN12470_c0_g2_i12.p4  ORF type:complete len:120 (-),score=11.84 TRINITY_DN12470_c0_g2_i12:300-659(-)